MSKYKIYHFIIIVILLGSCKIKQEIPQNRPMLSMPQNFRAVNDSTAFELPTIKAFFSDTTLIALIDTALHNNFDLRMTLQKIEMARAGVRFTQGLGKPDLTGNVAIGNENLVTIPLMALVTMTPVFQQILIKNSKFPMQLFPIITWEFNHRGRLTFGEN